MPVRSSLLGALLSALVSVSDPVLDPPEVTNCASLEVPLTADLQIRDLGGGRWSAVLVADSAAEIANGYAKIAVPWPAQIQGTPATWRGVVSAGQRLTLQAEFTLPAGNAAEIEAGLYALTPEGSVAFGRRASALVKTPGAAARPSRLRLFTGAAAALPALSDSIIAAGRLKSGADYYRFNGWAGERVSIQLWADGFDPALRLFDSQGVLLAENDDADGLNARLPSHGVLELPADGVYVVEAGGADGGEYHLLLAPAGGRQRLVAAVRRDADTVTISWPSVTAMPPAITIERACGTEPFAPIGEVSSTDGAWTTAQPPAPKVCQYRLRAAGLTSSVVVVPLAPAVRLAAQDATQIQGLVTYDSQETHSHPPLRRAKVEVRKRTGSNSVALATGATDDHGRFSLPVPAALLASGERVFARVYSVDRDSSGGEGAVANVLSPDLGVNFSADSDELAVSCSGCTVALPDLFLTADANGGSPDAPFFIFDALIEGYLIAGSQLGFPSAAVTAYYPAGDVCSKDRPATAACYGSGRIYIGRDQHASRDLLLHEYGHFVADQNHFLQTQGGDHFYPFGKRVNFSLAWGEGWATFFSIAGQHERGKDDINYDDNGSTILHYSLEDGHDPRSMPNPASMGDDNEGSVQFVLWDLYDDHADLLPFAGNALDTVALGFRRVFEVARSTAKAADGTSLHIERMARFYAALFAGLAADEPLQEILNLFRDQAMGEWPSPPVRPRNLRAGDSAGLPSLSWEGDLLADDSFEVERKPSAGAFAPLAVTRQFTYLDKTAPAEASYRVRAQCPMPARDDTLVLFSPPSNTVTATETGNAAGTAPDLVITSLSAPVTGALGGYLDPVQVRVENRGATASGSFRIGFYYSTRAAVSVSDIFSGWSCTYNDALAAGASWSCSGKVGIPAALAAGTYYFGAVVDNGDPANPTRLADTGPVRLAPSGAADLVVVSFTTPVRGSIGGRLSGIQAILRNDGLAPAGPFRLGFHYLKNASLTGPAVDSGWYCTLESLAAGAIWTCTGEIGIPDSLPSGVYYLAAVADDRDQVPESSKSNNLRLADSGAVTLEPRGPGRPALR